MIISLLLQIGYHQSVSEPGDAQSQILLKIMKQSHLRRSVNVHQNHHREVLPTEGRDTHDRVGTTMVVLGEVIIQGEEDPVGGSMIKMIMLTIY